jgi:hypothetical protein
VGFKNFGLGWPRGGFFGLALKKPTTAECINIYGLVSKYCQPYLSTLYKSGIANKFILQCQQTNSKRGHLSENITTNDIG